MYARSANSAASLSRAGTKSPATKSAAAPYTAHECSLPLCAADRYAAARGASVLAKCIAASARKKAANAVSAPSSSGGGAGAGDPPLAGSPRGQLPSSRCRRSRRSAASLAQRSHSAGAGCCGRCRRSSAAACSASEWPSATLRTHSTGELPDPSRPVSSTQAPVPRHRCCGSVHASCGGRHQRRGPRCGTGRGQHSVVEEEAAVVLPRPGGAAARLPKAVLPNSVPVGGADPLLDHAGGELEPLGRDGRLGARQGLERVPQQPKRQLELWTHKPHLEDAREDAAVLEPAPRHAELGAARRGGVRRSRGGAGGRPHPVAPGVGASKIESATVAAMASRASASKGVPAVPLELAGAYKSRASGHTARMRPQTAASPGGGGGAALTATATAARDCAPLCAGW